MMLFIMVASFQMYYRGGSQISLQEKVALYYVSKESLAFIVRKYQNELCDLRRFTLWNGILHGSKGYCIHMPD